jgi:aspartyl-tRNA(Asn)/glutamyl-tRNA(Gln) amidotransferase subunit A
MRKNELAFASLPELAALIRKKSISAEELVKTYLERIDGLQPRLNAYITVARQEAVASARVIDKALVRKCDSDKPLLGIPVALKDQISTQGILTTNGSLVLKDHIPGQDATVVARLKKAGAVILGKLNMTEFAIAGGEDPPFGEPRNPWNTDYSPGSSSSGSGIAVSAGLCAASIGEDSGGSGRIPANYCGVAGLRPSSGLVSRYGIHPASPALDTASPLGRNVADCSILLQVIAGYDPMDASTSRRPVPDYLAVMQKDIKGIRIGVIKEFMEDKNIDTEVLAAVIKAVGKLTACGASIDEVSIPYIRSSMYALGIIIWCDAAALIRKKYESKYHLFKQSTRVGLIAGSLLPSDIYLRALQAQSLIRSKILETLEKYDVLVCPTSPKPPPKIKDVRKSANFPVKDDVIKRHADAHTAFAPLAGCPAISIPCGFSKSGLPVGLQITGRPFEDATILRVAHAYEQGTDWHNHHPEL